MNFREIRAKFLDYFRGQGHAIVESSPLIPKEDPSLLFTNAGMVQFKRLFLGEEKRPYTRAATSQKCVRAGGKHNDLENVGYTARHHTFFEMLGNFSFGDYFKEEAIQWAWELLTEGYNIARDRLYVSVFEDDDEAYTIWQEKIGLPAERIVRLGEKDNFWAMAETGPCGPCSEILFDQGPSLGCNRPDCGPGCDCDRYLEIWNLVFTQFDRSPDGRLTPLPKPNIDTGMGLERLAAVVQGVKSNYEADVFRDIIKRVEELSGKRYGESEKQDVAFRVIADHARAVAFLIADGVMPSNEGRGYVLRRIIRRAIRFGQVLELKHAFLHSISSEVIHIMGPDYEELLRSRDFIESLVTNEEKRFTDTLQHGMGLLNEEIERLKARGGDTISGEVVFKLYDTYGLSVDIVQDVARDENLGVDLQGYEEAMGRQRRLSQESWKGSGEDEIPEVYRKLLAEGSTSRFVGYETLVARARVLSLVVRGRETHCIKAGVDQVEVLLERTPFYGQAGGQVGDVGLLVNGHLSFRVMDTLRYGENLIVHRGVLKSGTLCVGDEVEARVDREKRKATALNHSATHLLHAALREILGEHVKQAGSLVSPDKLRFDFSHFTQVAPEKLSEVERMVNRNIRRNFLIRTTEMSKAEAMRTGAMAIFEERYGDRVRLVSMGDDASMELCGGTHTELTGDIGLFRIVGEGAVAANVRRIEALTGEAALEYDRQQDRDLKVTASILKVAPDQVPERIERLLKELKEKEQEIKSLKGKLLSKKSEDLLTEVREFDGIRAVAKQVDAGSPGELREAGDRIKERIGSGVILLGARKQDKAMLLCMVTKDLAHRVNAGEIIKNLSAIVGGKGGGRPDIAQGGGDRPERLPQALAAFWDLVERKKG